MAEPQTGELVDERYRLDRKIGSGGMADVWLAEDTELDRKVAVKILHDNFAQDSEFVQRFQREAQAAAGLQHPNVVGIFDRGAFDGTYFIAMEYVDGPSLKDLVKGGMSPKDAIDFTRQILNAARFAHRKGIVHRDLKPQNVLIDDEGRARVADFGIARAGESSDITATGSVMGTAQYISPEQAQGRETTPRSDIYSIGVILYEALTGRVPFQGDSAVAVALKQVSEAPRRPSAINPNVPPALDAVVMRALAKDPDARFKDADAFLRALDAAEKAPDTARPQDTAAYAAVTPEGETEMRHGEVVEEEWVVERRSRRWRWIVLALLAAGVAALVAFALTRPSHVSVPDVIGQDVDAATQILDGKGFDVAIKAIPSGAPRNQVVEQDPIPTDRGGGKAEEGSTVTLSVSSGPAIVAVPDVAGLSVTDATNRLEKAGFKVTTRNQFSNSVPKGRAIGTEPAAGTQLSTSQVITLLVSRGTNQVEVPNVVGLDDQAALAALQEAGLSGVLVQRDSTEPEGKVISQSPGAGKLVARGSQVTVFASIGAITVPDVVGQNRKTAVTALKKAGFTVAVTEETTSDPAQVNRVISEFPPGGSRGRRGDTVTISVGISAPTSTTTTP
ncbi:MAG TPA: Stk1 family PASTA domain-containing Ser/Thr kinase [Solirubrobacterales bacterium]|nr:Stk1 family PASTA domain-containing Ser/Thr kinase [Solirubrobacterales bacterium]